jgi:hypothetical protein
VWQLVSNQIHSSQSLISVFLNYYRLNEQTLISLRSRIPKNYPLVHPELTSFVNSIQILCQGLDSLPSMNLLLADNAILGQGSDMAFEWIFDMISSIIKHGYHPDPSKGILVNLLPLCIELPIGNSGVKSSFLVNLCPKGTFKEVFKKIESLDSLKPRKEKNSE